MRTGSENISICLVCTCVDCVYCNAGYVYVCMSIRDVSVVLNELIRM